MHVLRDRKSELVKAFALETAKHSAAVPDIPYFLSTVQIQGKHGKQYIIADLTRMHSQSIFQNLLYSKSDICMQGNANSPEIVHLPNPHHMPVVDE